MRSLCAPHVPLLLTLLSSASFLDIPLEIEQPPTIVEQSPSPLITSSLEDSFTVTCMAKGNPQPEYRWTKDGRRFDPAQDPWLVTEENSGSFVIPNGKNLTLYQGNYRCYASNRLGTAVSGEIEFIVPAVPKFPKEKIDPIVVEEGEPVILECKPPKGIPPLHIYWMTIGLQLIEQNDRVSTSLDGSLYFSNTVPGDSRTDYCCFASFPRIRTIVQKTSVALLVQSRTSSNVSGSVNGSSDGESPVQQRTPKLLVPSGGETEVLIVKGKELVLECIAEGFPTPVIKWTFLGQKLPNHSKVELFGKRLKISKVSEEDEGQYMCKATNSKGETTHQFNVVIEEAPHWQMELEGQLRPIGSEVLIRCPVSGKPRPKLEVTVNGRYLNDVLVPWRKVLEDGVILYNAQQNDSAVYQCQASNKYGTILANINIMIMSIAPRVVTEDKLTYPVVEGNSISMHCRVFSSPPSTIAWVRNDHVESVLAGKISTDGSLLLPAAQKEDSGEYTCLTMNSEGKTSITAYLDVKDRTHIVDPPRDSHVSRGSTAHLECQAKIDPSLRNNFEILWEKDEEEIGQDHIENSRYILEDGVLLINNVSLEDQGTYRCIARTNLDQDMASAMLIVLDVPDAPKGLVLSEHKNRSVKLDWIPGDTHNSPTVEFLVEYEESQWEPGRWKELVLVSGKHTEAHLKLQGHIEYRFRVSAISDIGRGPPSQPTEGYRTPPAAPDKIPENIRIEANFPHEMVIRWEPLLPIEHNGPGLEYKVSYRRPDEEGDWVEQMIKRHLLVIKNTPTFVPYEAKIQARNDQGWGPESKVLTAHSGEDFPAGAPSNVAVDVMNSTLLSVSWTPVPAEQLQGRLGGHSLHWRRLRGLLEPEKDLMEENSLTIPGNINYTVVPGLIPFSEYSLTVSVFNGRGGGPRSAPVNFQTPEGVPESISILRATNAQKDSITLVWAPPVKTNGKLVGYLLQYQLINETVPPPLVNISGADTTRWVLEDLEELGSYRFLLSACTRAGCGPPIMEEGSLIPEPFRAGTSRVTVAQDWFICLMCIVVILTLVTLVAFFIKRNRGGKYSVKENEDFHPDFLSKGMDNNTFCEFSINDKKPLRSSLYHLDLEDSVDSLEEDTVSLGDAKVSLGDAKFSLEDVKVSLEDDRDSLEDSRDILEVGQDSLEDGQDSLEDFEEGPVEYADGECSFDEDGSFIGEYCGVMDRGPPEVNRDAPVTV